MSSAVQHTPAPSNRRAILWKTLINTFSWPIIHLLIATLFTRLPGKLFNPAAPFFRPRDWERHGAWYQDFLRIKSWKRLLPDGAAWLSGGFAKKKLTSRDPGYLQQFARETCRGEAAHWVMFGISPIYFLWNPAWAGWVMVIYAAAANIPCIASQRFIRPQLLRAARRISRENSGNGV